MKLTANELRKMPKVELHRHIEGSVRFETIRDLARHHQLDLDVASEKELYEKTRIKEPMGSLEEVLDAFETTRLVFCAYEAIKRIAVENIEDAFNDGIRLLELRFAPVFIAHNKNLAMDEVMEGVIDGISEGMERFDIQVGLIFIIPRGLDMDRHKEATQLFLKYRAGIHKNAGRLCGFDLADSETTTEMSNYTPLVDMVRDHGVGVTVHTGENTDAQHVRDSLEAYSPQRIGHGIKSVQDPDLMEWLTLQPVHFELCPTSNWLTRSVESIEEHPLTEFFKKGIPFSINSDDPHLMNIDLVDEYIIAHNTYGLTGDQLYRLNIDALDYSFLDKEIIKHTRKTYFSQ